MVMGARPIIRSGKKNTNFIHPTGILVDVSEKLPKSVSNFSISVLSYHRTGTRSLYVQSVRYVCSTMLWIWRCIRVPRPLRFSFSAQRSNLRMTSGSKWCDNFVTPPEPVWHRWCDTCVTPPESPFKMCCDAVTQVYHGKKHEGPSSGISLGWSRREQ